MLTSGIDIKAEPALEDEFNRIIDQVNALEMEALKVGNGFVPKEEETPAEVASDVTFAADPDIVAKAGPTWPPPLRLAADGERLRGRLHQLLCQLAARPQHAAALV